MPVINVSMQSGRTLETKAELARRLCDAMTEILGVPPDRVWIYLNEYDSEHLAVGGKLSPAAPPAAR